MIYLFATMAFALMQGFFSGIETGLISLQKPRVKNAVKQGSSKAKILDFFIHRPGLMLATTLLGTNICVASGALMAKKAAEAFGIEGSSAILLTTGIMTVILLGVEIVPKDWFRQAPFDRCMRFARVLYAAYFVLFIPAWVLAAFTDKVSRLLSKAEDEDVNSRILIREDFRLLLRDSESEGAIDSEAADILDKAIDFHTLKTGDVMVKRKQVWDIEASATIHEALELCKERHVSRVPVYLKGRDDGEGRQWVGIFSIYDAFFAVPEAAWDRVEVMTCLRPLTSVSAGSRLNEVLKSAKRGHSPLLIVTASGNKDQQLGIVTPIDVVKKLFG